MIYRITVAIVIVISLILVLLALTVNAMAEANSKGLGISPTRQQLTTPPDELTNGSFQIQNATDKPMTVTLSVKQFTTKNYIYDYVFSEPKDDWIRLEKTQLTLRPGEDTHIKFTANVPRLATPGGHYFAIFASTDVSTTGVRQTAQVVSLLFTKVTGKIIEAGSVDNGSVPFLVTGNEVTYKFDAKNTGNIDFKADFFGRLSGLFGTQLQTSASHVLMPDTIRSMGGSVPTPPLPGLYQLTYGYKTELDKEPTAKIAYILYLPIWFVAAVVLAICGGVWLRGKKRSHAR